MNNLAITNCGQYSSQKINCNRRNLNFKGYAGYSVRKFLNEEMQDNLKKRFFDYASFIIAPKDFNETRVNLFKEICKKMNALHKSTKLEVERFSSDHEFTFSNPLLADELKICCSTDDRAASIGHWEELLELFDCKKDGRPSVDSLMYNHSLQKLCEFATSKEGKAHPKRVKLMAKNLQKFANETHIPADIEDSLKEHSEKFAMYKEELKKLPRLD